MELLQRVAASSGSISAGKREQASPNKGNKLHFVRSTDYVDQNIGLLSNHSSVAINRVNVQQ